MSISTSPLVNRSTSDLLYGYLLSSAYQSPWIYDPSLASLREPEVWEVVRNNGDMLAAIQRRNNAIVRPWRVGPNYHGSFNVHGEQAGQKKQADDSKRLAAIAHEAIAHIDRFDAARQLLSEAFFLGRKYAIIYWERARMSLGGAPEMAWWLPTRLKDLDRRRVHWVPDWRYVKPDGTTEAAGPTFDWSATGGPTISQVPHPKGGYLQKVGHHLEIFNTDNWSWERVSQEQRRNLVEYIYYDEEDRIGHGRGVIEAGFFIHYFLTGVYKKLIEGIDRYANGILIGRLDSLRNASTTKTTTDLRNAMRDVLLKSRSEHVIVLEEGDKIEVVEPQGRGFQTAMEFKKDLVETWERLCNGSTRPAGVQSGATGARAQAETEADTSESFYQNGRNDMDNVLSRDLLGAFLYHNQENLFALGLQDAKLPKFTSEQIRRQEPADAIAVMSQVLAAGQPIKKTQFYENVDLDVPSPDDEVVEPGFAIAAQGIDMATGKPFPRDQNGNGNGNGNGKSKSDADR